MAYPIDDGPVWSVWQIMSSTGLLFEKNFSFEITGRPTRARPDPDPPPPLFCEKIVQIFTTRMGVSLKINDLRNRTGDILSFYLVN